MNTHIAEIVDELYEMGIREIVLSPGARSSPLAILFCEHKFKVYMNIDERSAAFFALGIAKEQCRPVVLVCTSGSAAAHYLPAAIEAKHSRIPLIFLTADRPPELQYVGAPQTINQHKLLGEFLLHYEELTMSNGSINLYPRLVIQRAYMHCNSLPKGPVQINIPLREPLIPVINLNIFEIGRRKHTFEYIEGEISVNFDTRIFAEKNGMIICGGDAFCEYQEDIIALAENIKAPILADPLSNLRNFGSPAIIYSYDAFLKNEALQKSLRPDYVLLFGQTPISKRLFQFLSLHSNIECYQVDSVAEYRNPALTNTKFIHASPEAFIKAIICLRDDASYQDKWIQAQISMSRVLKGAMAEEILFEGKIVQLLQNMMPKKSNLSIANSMAIRDVDYFWEAKKQSIRLLGNRGSNGIDGTVSTALGIASSGTPTVLLTGDLAFFHDMNGLLMAKTHKISMIIVLLNNDGGGIFQYLPQAQVTHFDYLFSTPHGMNFEGLQALYGLKHQTVTDYTDFEEKFKAALNAQGISVLEVKIDMNTSKQLHDKYTSLK